MRRDESLFNTYRDSHVIRFDPLKTYVFYMPGMRIRNFLYVFLLLGLPGIAFLIYYDGGIPSPEAAISLTVVVILFASLSAQFFANRVILTPEEVVIRKDGQHFVVRLYDIEHAFIAESLDEVDAVHLPSGHYPMEFESYDRNIAVLVLRDNTVSTSTSERYNGIITKAVSFNVAKPQRFLSLLRMRI